MLAEFEAFLVKTNALALAVGVITPDGSLPDHAQVQATTDRLQAALAGLGGGKR